MARFLLLWQLNWAAPWPVDPPKSMELNEKLWAGMDYLMKKGLVKEYGIFPDGQSGFLIAEGEATDVYMGANMFIPYVSSEVHEIISYEKQKEIIRGLFQAQIAAMKK